jgi:hypothetical protein
MKTFHLDTLPFLRKKLASPSLAARWQASGAGNHLSELLDTSTFTWHCPSLSWCVSENRVRKLGHVKALVSDLVLISGICRAIHAEGGHVGLVHEYMLCY